MYLAVIQKAHNKNRMIKSIQITLLLFSVSCTGAIAQSEDFKIFGYLPHYRFDEIERIDLDKLTHLCLGFAHPDRTGAISFGGEDIFPVMVEAKDRGLKTLMTLAGGAITPEQEANWDYWLKPWNRHKLIEEIVIIVEKYEFDGVDVDLEWNHVDRHYNGFVVGLKSRLAERGKILTAALPGKKRYEVLTDDAIQAFDYIQLMAYDVTGPFAPHRPGPHSPLHFAQRSIEFWVEQGVDREKLILGIPLYGWEFTDRAEVFSVSYGFMVSRDTAYAQKDQVGGTYYNGIPTVVAKTELAREKAGGIMFWELGQDAFNDYSLLSAAHRIVASPEEVVMTEIDRPQVVRVSSGSADAHAVETLIAEVTEAQPWQGVRLFLSPHQKRLFLIKENEGQRDIVFRLPEYPSGLYLLANILGIDLFSGFIPSP